MWLALAIGGFALNSLALSTYFLTVRAAKLKVNREVAVFFIVFYVFDASCLAMAYNHTKVAGLLVVVGFATHVLIGRPSGSSIRNHPRRKRVKRLSVAGGLLIGGLAFWWVAEGEGTHSLAFWGLVLVALICSLTLSVFAYTDSRR
jgi:hypothetical protein